MTNIQYHGSNLSGGDTAYTQWAGRTPKEAVSGGGDYLFVSTKDIDYLIAKGCNLFRLLFTWEAIQPQSNGVIPSANADHKKYYDTFKARVDYITSKGKDVLIDIHGGLDAGFAAYYGTKIGTNYNGVPVTDLFCNLWAQLARIFKDNPRVLFGITNEPSNMPTMVWFAAAQKVIDAIRATGSKHKIVMPGNGFTAASSWSGSLWTDTGVPARSNAYGWLNANGLGKPLTDPANNLALQVHLYADSGAGGFGLDVVNGTVLRDRVKGVVEWGRANKVQVLVAEVGLAGDAVNAAPAWNSFVTYLNDNSDVVLGYTFWSYGPPIWWGGYKFSLCPKDTAYTVDSPTMNMIETSLALPVPGPVTPPPPPPPPVDPQVAILQAQVADLTAKLKTSSDNNTTYMQQVTALTATIGDLTAQLASANNLVSFLNSTLSKIKALIP